MVTQWQRAKVTPEEAAALVKADRERMDVHMNFPAQARIPTMEKKVAIEAAIPGWLPKGWYEDRGVKNLPPISFQDQADCIAECVKAGAALIHHHPRDPNVGIILPNARNPEILRRSHECFMEVMDRAHDQVDFVTSSHTWFNDTEKNNKIDYITHTKWLLEDGQKKGIGNFYVQQAMIMTIGRPDIPTMQEAVKWFETHDIKPMFSCEEYAIDTLKREFFDNGVANSKPYWIALQEGKHDINRTFADPWCALEVTTTIGLVKAALGERAIIGFHPAGRNWLQIAAQAILGGAEFVRVGLEDLFYLYPHRDDISQNASDSTKIIVNLIHALGREVATPADVRNRANIKLIK